MIEKLKEMIRQGDVVFFGGAGVSTSSGMKDFRSEDGLYNEKGNNISPETILSHNFFYQHPTDFYKYYREKMNCLEHEPNVIHKTLAKWEEEGLLNAVITQNIDNLHQKAGSKNVIELHGTCMKNHCVKCGKEFSAEEVFYGENKYPTCDECGRIIRPDIVLYGENLPKGALFKAEEELQRAKTCIVAGTSLTVFPAANLISYFYGQNLVVLNKQKVPNEEWADIVIHEDMKDVFEALSDI